MHRAQLRVVVLRASAGGRERGRCRRWRGRRSGCRCRSCDLLGLDAPHLVAPVSRRRRRLALPGTCASALVSALRVVTSGAKRAVAAVHTS